MRSSLRARTARVLAAGAIAAALVLPAGTPAAAADPVILRVGTTQDLDSLNPYATLLVVGYEAFQLNYNLLVDFGPDLEPIPGFADKWERAADGKSWTFHIRDGMKWSDGTPATSADACFSWQLALDAIKDGGAGSLGAGYLDPGLDDAKVTKVECPDDSTMIAYTEDASDRVLETYLPIIPKHIWGKETSKTIGDAKFDAPLKDGEALVGTGPYQAVEWQTGQFVRFERNPNYWGPKPFAGRGRHPDLQDRGHDGPGAQGRRDRLRARHQRRAAQGAQDRAEHPDRRRLGQRLDAARVQHLRHRDGQDDQGRRAVHQGAARPGFP